MGDGRLSFRTDDAGVSGDYGAEDSDGAVFLLRFRADSTSVDAVASAERSPREIPGCHCPRVRSRPGRKRVVLPALRCTPYRRDLRGASPVHAALAPVASRWKLGRIGDGPLRAIGVLAISRSTDLRRAVRD